MTSPRPDTDSGREFEKRALAIARAIHDPSGSQGAINFRGREHDGVFVNDQAVVAFEFTKDKSKDKAKKDAEKIRDVLSHLRVLTENRHKFAHGFFITSDEPTSDQREAVDRVAAASRIDIKCMSVVTLRRSLIDSEDYLAKRRAAPFGSTAFKLPQAAGRNYSPLNGNYVEPTFKDINGPNSHTFSEILSGASSGERIVLVGDFGAGKSEAMFRLYDSLRRSYFKNTAERQFPIHINLRDCYGLRSPREVLSRHADEVGFGSAASLIAAWRSGACILLLDGFDELVPARWVGGARDLKQVRWQALEPVRRLVSETPSNCSIVATGRSQYFSNEQELLECVAMEGSRLFSIQDLSEDQVKKFANDSTVEFPDWVPRRALLLKFLLENRLLGELDSDGGDAYLAWLAMLDVIAAREADRISSVTRASVLRLIARIATIARGGDDSLGPITIEDMRTAFRETCQYEPDEEGLQLLLRLPGLASSGTSSGAGPQNELRRFVDVALADAAYGVDLYEYVASPYSAHPLADSVSWTASSNELSVGVTATKLTQAGFEPNHTFSAIKKRLDDSKFDAVLLDVCNLGDAMGASSATSPPFFFELIIRRLNVRADGVNINRGTFRDCLIETLDVSESSDATEFPSFQSCVIGRVEGWRQIPERFARHFDESTEIGEVAAGANNTAGLVELNLSVDTRVALIVLRKVYMQAGTGRRESALPRGIPLSDRPRVPEITSRLVSAGFLEKRVHKGQNLVLPVKDRRTEVQGILETPHTFVLP